MAKRDQGTEMDERILLLETQVRHLKNELELTRKENDLAMNNYFEIYSKLEDKVAERTGHIKKLKKVLEQKARELEIMLDSSPAMVFYKDIHQRLIRVNRKFAKTVGLPAREIIGKKYSDLFPGDEGHGLTMDRDVIKRGKPIYSKRETMKTHLGDKEILIDRIPYKDINNNVAGLICFALDITELEKAEEEKRKLEAQLQQAQRIESIGTLAGGIAHNFNNLLMGILGNVSLMLMDIDTNHTYYKNLATIEKLVKNGSELTRQLLGYAREGNYEIKPVSMNQLVKETAETFGVTRKEIRVHKELDSDLLSIKVDQGQIKQVLLNLYINAADALPHGGDLYLKTKNISHDDLKNKPYKTKQKNYVLLTVRDTGAGMDQETMEHIFEPFFTTKGLAKGTGLGLASAYGIIKAHSGFIDVESEVGKGTTFSIYLPATETVVAKDMKRSGELLKGKETILLVDDESVIVDLGQRMLEMLGYCVLTADSGGGALELYRENHDKVDMVLLDMIMPDMGGGETYDRLKEIDPDIKVLLSSGYSIDGQAQEILDRGCNGFIQKPFTIEEVSQKIRDILQAVTIQESDEDMGEGLLKKAV